MAAFQHILIAAHPHIDGASHEADMISVFLEKHGINADSRSLFDPEVRKRLQTGGVDLLIALGGDGTMLRAGHFCAPLQVPILGVKMGHFSFLMEINKECWPESLERILNGDYWDEKRLMLRCDHYREGELLGSWEILNEAVVSRGQVGHPIQLMTDVDGRFLTTFVADGLIVSTPTGSTAYALAAGGPILPPDLRNILLVPLAPHLSIDRSIVLAEGSSVRITVRTNYKAILCNDGQEPIQMEDGDSVDVFASDHSAHFIHAQDPGYFYRNLIPHLNQNPFTGVKR